MGMCKECEKVFNVLAMKDGLCKECYKKINGTYFMAPDLSVSHRRASKNKTNEVSTPVSVYFWRGFFSLLLIGGIVYFIGGMLGLFWMMNQEH